ncbi:hypothetical protein TGRUB_434380, partial [Toxoplasma gondii RUB]
LSLPAGVSPDELHAPSASFAVPSALTPQVFDSLSSPDPVLRKSTGDLALSVLTGVLVFLTFSVGILPPSDEQSSSGPEDQTLTSDRTELKKQKSNSPAAISPSSLPSSSTSSAASSVSSSSCLPASDPLGCPFPSASFVRSWWPQLRAELGVGTPEQVSRQLEARFVPFSQWPGEEQSPLKTFYLWKCDVVGTAAALVGLRCTQRALLEILNPREILHLWVGDDGGRHLWNRPLSLAFSATVKLFVASPSLVFPLRLYWFPHSETRMALL